MKRRIPEIVTACFVAVAVIFFHQFYFPVRDGVIYACGVIAGQDSVSETDREASYCTRWRERAESVGFNPFGKATK